MKTTVRYYNETKIAAKHGGQDGFSPTCEGHETMLEAITCKEVQAKAIGPIIALSQHTYGVNERCKVEMRIVKVTEICEVVEDSEVVFTR